MRRELLGEEIQSREGTIIFYVRQSLLNKWTGVCRAWNAVRIGQRATAHPFAKLYVQRNGLRKQVL